MTPQERIAAMRKQVDDIAEKKRLEEERKARRGEVENDLKNELLMHLKPLTKLPVTPNGIVVIFAEFIDRVWQVSVDRLGWETINGEEERVDEKLIVFCIQSNHEGKRAWITHDDESIDLSIALDLAVAVVESRFSVAE